MKNLSIYEALFPKGIKSNGCHMKYLYIVIIYCGVIKQNESEVDTDMLLVSDCVYTSDICE